MDVLWFFNFLEKRLFPGSDSHNLIGILAKTSLGSETVVAHNVARLGELEIMGIMTSDSIPSRRRACSGAFNERCTPTKEIRE